MRMNYIKTESSPRIQKKAADNKQIWYDVVCIDVEQS